MFKKIISLRNGDRINGAFTEFPIEGRIRRLEEGMDKANNLIEEIVEWITGLPSNKKNDDNDPLP